jgi:hypothetical protein
MPPTTTTAAPIHLSNREQLKDYCLRRLGAPVIDINVSEEQVEDRIQDAIEFFQEYHYDGTERLYLKQQVEASTITLTTADAASYNVGEVVNGSLSGATAKIHKILDDNVTLQLRGGSTAGTFVDGEIVTGETSGTAKIIEVNGFVLRNWDLQYFTISDAVTGVERIFIVGPGTAGTNTRNIFDVVYQFRLNDMYDLMSTDLIYYAQVKMHLSMLDMMLPGERSIRFNRKQGRLFVDMNWSEQFTPGAYIIAECYRILDPTEFSKVYNDLFLKKFATALIKRQWGNNLKKFGSIQVLGGVTLNGQSIYDEAVEEIEKLESEMQNRWETPPFFEIG